MGKVIGFSNFADTIVSYFKNEATAQRTYTFPDEDVDFSPIDYSEGTWVPTFAGFSVNPTVSAARYTTFGRLCTCIIAMSANGTSNATTSTMTLPFAAANTVVQSFHILIVDNGTIGADVGKLNTRVNSNVADLFKTLASGVWTASGAKGWTFTITYEMAV